MEKLIAKFSEIESTSKKIKTNNEELVKVVDQINSANSELKQYWIGEDADKYIGKVEEKAKEMQELLETIAYTSEYLSFVSNSLQDVMKNNTSMVK